MGPLPDKRIREEIEGILERDERRSRRRSSAGLSAIRLTPDRLMLAGLGALVLALVVRGFFAPLGLAAVALFGLGYAMRLKRGQRGARRTPPHRPAQREQPVAREGNVIELRDSWRNRLRRWLRGRWLSGR